MHCLKRHFTSKMAIGDIGVSSRHRHTHVLGVVLIPYFGWMRIQLYPLFWREQKGTHKKNWNQTYFVVGIFSFVMECDISLYHIVGNYMKWNEFEWKLIGYWQWSQADTWILKNWNVPRQNCLALIQCLQDQGKKTTRCSFRRKPQR